MTHSPWRGPARARAVSANARPASLGLSRHRRAHDHRLVPAAACFGRRPRRGSVTVPDHDVCGVAKPRVSGLRRFIHVTRGASLEVRDDRGWKVRRERPHDRKRIRVRRRVNGRRAGRDRRRIVLGVVHVRQRERERSAGRGSEPSALDRRKVFANDVERSDPDAGAQQAGDRAALVVERERRRGQREHRRSATGEQHEQEVAGGRGIGGDGERAASGLDAVFVRQGVCGVDPHDRGRQAVAAGGTTDEPRTESRPEHGDQRRRPSGRRPCRRRSRERQRWSRVPTQRDPRSADTTSGEGATASTAASRIASASNRSASADGVSAAVSDRTSPTGRSPH